MKPMGARWGLATLSLMALLAAVAMEAPATAADSPECAEEQPVEQPVPPSQAPASASQGTTTTAAPPVLYPPLRDPLTVKQKLWYGLDRGLGPAALLGAFATGGYQQYFNQNKGYGQGADGYFARVGARYAKTATKHMLGSFILASVFHQDPRYNRSNHPSKKVRLGYALSRVVVTRGDNGRRQFNISGVGGTMGAALISKTWHRPPDDTFRRSFQRGGFTLGIEAARNIFREFWPEIRRVLGRR